MLIFRKNQYSINQTHKNKKFTDCFHESCKIRCRVIFMDRNISIIILLMLAVIALALSSCITSIETKGSRNSRSYLDWQGVYKAVILSNEGNYIDVRIRLNLDQSFEFYYERMDGAFDPFYWKGVFQWDKTENIIIADINYVHQQYKVEKNKLIRLDVNNFILVKEQ